MFRQFLFSPTDENQQQNNLGEWEYCMPLFICSELVLYINLLYNDVFNFGRAFQFV